MKYASTVNKISVLLWRSVFVGGGKRSTHERPETCRK